MVRRRIPALVILALTILSTLPAYQPYVAKAEAPYHVPITITERSGHNLYNYTIRVELNETNFNGWPYTSDDGSDIYFTDAVGNPLYYWIEYFNKDERKAVIWVKVPEIPANGTVTIYMQFGGENPYTSYNNPSKTFLLYDEFSGDTLDTSKWGVYCADNNGVYATCNGYVEVVNGWLHIKNPLTRYAVVVYSIDPMNFQPGLIVRAKIRWYSPSTSYGHNELVFLNETICGNGGCNNRYDFGPHSGHHSGYFYTYFPWFGRYAKEFEVRGQITKIDSLGAGWDVTEIVEFRVYNGTTKLYINDNYVIEGASPATNSLHIVFAAWNEASSGTEVYVDWVVARCYTEPEPFVSIGGISAGLEKVMYRVPITIIEQSGETLYNYSIRIELNETNFEGWSRILDGSDVYFTDANGKPLYYWIEYFNKTERKAIIWVKVPEIPANSRVIIYMWFGGENSYANYNDPSKTFLVYDDFSVNDLGTRWIIVESDNVIEIVDGMLHLYDVGASAVPAEEVRYYEEIPTTNIIIELRAMYTTARDCWGWNIKLVNDTDKFVVRFDWFPPLDVGYYTDETGEVSLAPDYLQKDVWYNISVAVLSNGVAKIIVDKDVWTVNHELTSSAVYLGIWASGSLTPGNEIHLYVDWIRVRHYVEPEPEANIGEVEVIIVGGLRLPESSAYLVHNIVYSPDATQFAYEFSAANESYAGYNVGDPDAYGFKVWVEPADGVANKATLIASVNVTLPYESVVIENLTLYAAASGTGGLRQLTVKILDANGTVIAELENATLANGWTEVVLEVNDTVSDMVTIWINATVASTTTDGGWLAVKDVKLGVKHVEGLSFYVARWEPNAEYFNCTAVFAVLLGSEELVNTTTLLLKLVEYLTYNGTTYPVKPVYVGNETINGLVYQVYSISPANTTGSFYLYALLENALRKKVKIHVNGLETTSVLAGELLTIELPVPGNISIPELGLEFVNTSLAHVKLLGPGLYTIVANTTAVDKWRLGYVMAQIRVDYGNFSMRVFDLAGSPEDYEPLVLQLVNASSGKVVQEVRGWRFFTLDNLLAGNYTIRVLFKGIVVAEMPFTLNSTTTGAIVDVTLNMLRFERDYRGLGKVVVAPYNVKLLGVEDYGGKYSLSRISIALEGSGAFTICIDYRGWLPTQIRVVGNVTNLRYWWDGTCLMVYGRLGSVGIINVTDLYRLRIELYDRLGNFLPAWAYATINDTMYHGGIIAEYVAPGTYLVTVPVTINGFEFAGFWDGYNATSRVVEVNDTNVELKVWYRVPTRVEEAKSFQVATLRLPFIHQGDTVKVYIEGYLRDYYGDGVPDRVVVVTITDEATGATWDVHVVTDATGYFRTPLLDLVRGRTYKITISYEGDSVYVGSTTTLEFKPEELPVQQPIPGVPIEYIVLAASLVVVAAGVTAALKAVRHTIEGLHRERRYVRKK